MAASGFHENNFFRHLNTVRHINRPEIVFVVKTCDVYCLISEKNINYTVLIEWIRRKRYVSLSGRSFCYTFSRHLRQVYAISQEMSDQYGDHDRRLTRRVNLTTNDIGLYFVTGKEFASVCRPAPKFPDSWSISRKPMALKHINCFAMNSATGPFLDAGTRNRLGNKAIYSRHVSVILTSERQHMVGRFPALCWTCKYRNGA